jgi:vitamin B12 transporter
MSSWSYSQYGQKKYTGGYAVIDFGASYPINDWASVYGRVENITDKFWHTTSEYAETGRAGYAGVRMKF